MVRARKLCPALLPQRPGGAQGGGEDSEILSDFGAKILGSTCSLVPPEIPHLDAPAPVVVVEDVEAVAMGSTIAAIVVIDSNSLWFFFCISVCHGHRLRDGVRR